MTFFSLRLYKRRDAKRYVLWVLCMMATVSIAGERLHLVESPAAAVAFVMPIEAVGVQWGQNLQAGAVVHISVFGLPQAQVVVRIVGALYAVALQESDAGHYEGTYTRTAQDHVDSRSAMAVSLRSKQGDAMLKLEGKFASAAPSLFRDLRSLPMPELGALRILPVGIPVAGVQLLFFFNGVPHGEASITVTGIEPAIVLSEIAETGNYGGSYTIRPYDTVSAVSVVSVELRLNAQVHRASLGQYFQEATAPMPILGN